MISGCPTDGRFGAAGYHADVKLDELEIGGRYAAVALTGDRVVVRSGRTFGVVVVEVLMFGTPPRGKVRQAKVKVVGRPGLGWMIGQRRWLPAGRILMPLAEFESEQATRQARRRVQMRRRARSQRV